MSNKILKASPYYLEDVLGLKLDERAAIGKISYLLLNQPPLCDAHCRRCFMPEYRRDSSFTNALTLKESKKVLEQAREYGALCLEISGEGEPTLSKNLNGIIQHADSLDYLTTLITNGHNLTEEEIEFYRCHNVTLIFSHFSLDQHKYEQDNNNPGSFDSKMMALERAAQIYSGAIERKEKCDIYRLAIHATLQQDNINDILEIKKYCKEREIFFSIAPLAQTGCALDHPNLRLEDVLKVNGKDIALSEVPSKLGDNSIIHSHSSARELGREVCGTCFYGLNIGYDGNLLLDAHAGYEIGNLLGDVRNNSIKKLIKRQREISWKLFNEIDGFCPVREDGLVNLIKSFDYKKYEEIQDFYCEGGGMIASFLTAVGSVALVLNYRSLLGVLGLFAIFPMGMLGAEVGHRFGKYRFNKKYPNKLISKL